jgi:hypothetical protein
MKFARLDARVRDTHEFSSSKYQYLDELLDKTFVTDYFLDRSATTALASDPQSITP